MMLSCGLSMYRTLTLLQCLLQGGQQTMCCISYLRTLQLLLADVADQQVCFDSRTNRPGHVQAHY